MKIYKLSEITTAIFSGGTPSSANSYYWNGSFNWLSSGETRNQFIHQTERTITQAGIDNSSTRLAKTNDVVIASAGQGHTRGQASFLCVDTYINQSLIAVRAKRELVLPKYLFYLLSTKYEKLRSISDSASTRGSITTKLLGDLEFAIESLNKQQHIVDTIGSVDDLIEKNEEIIEKAKAIIDQFYSSTIVEEKQSTLKDFFDITIGRTPPTKENRWFSLRRKENVCWLSIKDMAQNATFIFETSQYLTREAITKFRIPIVEEGDVLLSFKLTVGRTAIAGTKMVTNEAIACFKCKAEYRNYLLCYLQNCDFMSDGGNTSSIGKAINSTIIKNFPFAIPTDNSLNKFNNNTGPFFKLIKYKQRENMILKTQKERLLSKYFGSN